LKDLVNEFFKVRIFFNVRQDVWKSAVHEWIL
jgi:hypothetical protein